MGSKNSQRDFDAKMVTTDRQIFIRFKQLWTDFFQIRNHFKLLNNHRTPLSKTIHLCLTFNLIANLAPSPTQGDVQRLVTEPLPRIDHNLWFRADTSTWTINLVHVSIMIYGTVLIAKLSITLSGPVLDTVPRNCWKFYRALYHWHYFICALAQNVNTILKMCTNEDVCGKANMQLKLLAVINYKYILMATPGVDCMFVPAI